MSRIFISYRRQDSALMTGRIYDRLENIFGGNRVFRDIDDISAGEDFRAKLAKEIDQSDILLIIIGPKWENITDSNGNRRLNDPNDFVRLEVEAGLKRTDKIVIPVLVENAQMPNSATLPESLRELCYRNAINVRQDPDFNHDMQKLVGEIKGIDKATRPFYARTPFLIAGGLTALCVFGVVIAGFFTYLNNTLPRDVPANDPPVNNEMANNPATATLVPPIDNVPDTANITPTFTPIAIQTPTVISAYGSIPFGAPDNASALNPVLIWQQGGSSASGYDLTLNPGWFTMITGKETDQVDATDSAPLVYYPYFGNFTATVKMEFVSNVCCQHAGIGVRSAADHTTWLRIAKHENNGMRAAANTAGRVTWLDYAPAPGNVVYFKVERSGSVFNLSYSADNVNWTALESNYIFELPNEVEIYLLVLSVHNGEGILAKFSDFTVTQK